MAEELTPEQEERVRRLLAEARHDEPIPADVAARLDRALDDEAGLRSVDGEPDRERAGGTVVRLADRRRNAGRLLLAAAVVVVGGVAVGQVVDDGGIGGSSAESDATSADSEQGADLPAPQRAESGRERSGAVAPDEQPGAVADHLVTISKAPPQTVRSDRFAADAARLRAVAIGRRSAKSSASSDRVDAPRSAAEGEICTPGAWGGGRYVRVQVDAEAGWLVYRPPRGETEVVDLFLCGEDDPERSTTIPLR